MKSKYPAATGSHLVQHLVHTAGEGRFDWRRGRGFGSLDLPGMLASSPLQWPDENALWLFPRDTLDDYPMWVSTRIPDPGERRTEATEQPRAGRDRTAPGSTAPRRRSQTGLTSAFGGADGPLPSWGWPALVVALAASTGVLAMVRRGRRRNR